MKFEISSSEYSQSIGMMGWRNNDDRKLFKGHISFHEDGSKYNLTFFFKVGAPNRPLIIGFPGYLADASGGGVFFDFVGPRFSDCTVVTLNDREGESRLGSWYLGKSLPNGSFSYLSLIPALVSHFVERFQPTRTIFYGTSMGGFGSLLFSLLISVDEVYLCVPQTNVNPSSHYFRRDPKFYNQERNPFTPSTKLAALGLETHEKFMAKLRDHPYLDISYFNNLVDSTGRVKSKYFDCSFSKYYHIVSARYDHHQDTGGTYYRQMIHPLISSFVDHNILFSNTNFPFAMHDAFIYPQGILEYSEDALQNSLSSNNSNRLRAEQRIYCKPHWRPFMIAEAYKLWF